MQSGMHGRNINECRSNDCQSNECRRNNCRSYDCRSNETTPKKGQSRETGKIATFVLPIVHVCSIHLPHVYKQMHNVICPEIKGIFHIKT